MIQFHRLEGLVRGFSNHRRIQILYLLKQTPELSVEEIALLLKADYKTISAHLKRLAISGLIMKRSDGLSIRHKLSPRGNLTLTFLKQLE